MPFAGASNDGISPFFRTKVLKIKTNLPSETDKQIPISKASQYSNTWRWIDATDILDLITGWL